MRKRFLAILMVLAMFVISGCSNESTKEVSDREGNKVSIPSKIEKIVSTAPSNTEIIADLGMGDKLVAVDSFSSEIEGVNKNAVKIDFANPDAEAIIGLDPDLIIAAGINKSGNAEDPYKAMSDAGISVVYLPSSDSIEGIYKDIEFIADILDKKPEGEKLISDMKNKIEEVKTIGNSIKNKKKVYFEINPAPSLYTFGNSTYLNEMIEIIGAENIFKDEESWIAPSAEAVIDKNPDVILTNVNYIDDPIGEIKSRQSFENIKAVKEDKIYSINTDSSSRGTHKITIALDEMARAIYPEHYEK